jgi:metal-responsive CopG/Arc/MetJ family transcriptional regulator
MEEKPVEEVEIEYSLKKQKNKVVITFKAEKELVEVLECLRRRMGLTHRSEVIRRAIKLLQDLEGGCEAIQERIPYRRIWRSL